MTFPPIPETHLNRLKTVLGIVNSIGDPDEARDLPADVERLYWRCEKLSRKIGNRGVTDDLLVMIAVLSGSEPELEVPSFLDTARQLDRGDIVEVVWKDRWIEAIYYGIKSNKILASIPDDAEVTREFDPTAVRLPEGAQLTEAS